MRAWGNETKAETEAAGETWTARPEWPYAGSVRATTVTPGEPLSGTLDPEAIARGMPRSYVVKGMFFSRLVGELGAGFEALLPRLDAPPRFGRYVPFTDYPQSDYLRVSAACAAKVFPAVPLREALRRLGRADYEVFSTSTFGRVILSVVGDAREALLKTPFIYAKMAPGDWTITGEDLDPSTVRIEFAPVYGTWEYQLGQLEGVVLNFGGSPVITVEDLPGKRLRFDIRHA